MNKKRRKRGIILTPLGLRKLKQARGKFEKQDDYVARYTYEKLSDITCLDTNTVIRVLKCREGVDKRTLERFFIAFNLELTDEDYAKPDSVKDRNLKDAVSVANFYGRTAELIQLQQWLLQDRCRILNILGIAGVGKTALSVKLVETIGNKFDHVVWKSFKETPAIDRFLLDLIQSLSSEPVDHSELPSSTRDRIAKVIDCLRSRRCLLVFDNLESILCSRIHAGKCRPEYEAYEELWRRVGETDHQSCLLVASREKPSSIAVLEGEKLPVKTFKLRGLKEEEGINILKTKGLNGSELDLNQLVEQCYGNALAMKIVATTINDVFAGNVAKFLTQKKVMFGDLYQLVNEQIERLSILEQKVVYWLAIHQQPITFTQLWQKIDFIVSELDLIEVLESLSRRSIVVLQQSCFTLQPIFREYILCRSAKNRSIATLA